MVNKCTELVSVLLQKWQKSDASAEPKKDGGSCLTWLIDYNVYVMDKHEKVKYVLWAAAVLFALGYVFFNNLVISMAFTMGALFYPKYRCRELVKKRKDDLNLQFKDALYSISSALSIGRSLESAFKAALLDLRMLYTGESAYIIKEFEYICRKIELNQAVENALLDFAKRSGLDDIKNFAEVIVICRRSGGNLVQVVNNTSNIISEKIEIGQDINLLLTKQKYEQKILNVMPVVFIALIKFGGSGYMDSLYTSFKGYLLMALAMAILVTSMVISKSILDIKV